MQSSQVRDNSLEWLNGTRDIWGDKEGITTKGLISSKFSTKPQDPYISGILSTQDHETDYKREKFHS